MRANFLQQVIDETPKDVKIFVRLYADITIRVHEIMKCKGITQKDLAEAMDKKPSEISKWLKGEHNFTLRSLAKLEAELDEIIINVPKSDNARTTLYHPSRLSVKPAQKSPRIVAFSEYSFKHQKTEKYVS